MESSWRSQRLWNRHRTIHILGTSVLMVLCLSRSLAQLSAAERVQKGLYASTAQCQSERTHVDCWYTNTSKKHILIKENVQNVGIADEYETATIGEGITEIDGNSFIYCYALASISIPDGITRVGGNAFANCNSLLEITFPASLTNLAQNSVNNCKNLMNIWISETSYTKGPYYSDNGVVMKGSEPDLEIVVVGRAHCSSPTGH